MFFAKSYSLITLNVSHHFLRVLQTYQYFIFYLIVNIGEHLLSEGIVWAFTIMIFMQNKGQKKTQVKLITVAIE